MSSSSHVNSASAAQQSIRGVIHVASLGGHRKSYLDLLASILRLTPLSGPVDAAKTRKMLKAPILFLATFDDKVALYSGFALVRGLLGRPTVALFLRPQSCFNAGSARSRLKWAIFRLIRRIPCLRLITITPFSIARHYGEVAHAGVWDPQYWDLFDGIALRVPSMTPLSEEIRQRAEGRPILCMPGSLVRRKGFCFLSEMARTNPILFKRLLVVAAGSVSPETRNAAEEFRLAGGMLVDRRLDDAEVESLYVISDAIWACYSPDYDQASGIFGRAAQLGTPIILRRGSLIEKLAVTFAVPHISLSFEDAAQAAAQILRNFPRRTSAPGAAERVKSVATRRDDFLLTVERAL